MMVGLSLYIGFDEDEIISMAYDLYDPESNGSFLFNEMMKIFRVTKFKNVK